MVKRSLKASKEGIIEAKKSFERRQWSQEYLAAEVGLSTRNSIWKFFSGRPIDRHIFMEICFKLDLEWEEIADLPVFPENEQVEKKTVQNNSKKDNLLTSENNKLETLRIKLKGHIKNQCNHIQTSFAFNQQLPLEALYIEPKVFTSIRSQRWLDISDFNKSFSQLRNQKISPSTEQKIDAFEVINSSQRIILMGKPGSGKSTFLRYLALTCIENKVIEQCLPIFISLKILGLQKQQINNFNLLNYIKETWQVFGISSEEIDTLAIQGKILVLIDSVETISEEHIQSVLAAIQQFTNIYYQCRVIISCRFATTINILQGFQIVELADFDEQQVKEFVTKWFTVNNSSLASELNVKHSQFLELLKRPENQLVKELTQTPILLSLLCSVFQNRGQFPTQLSKLYHEALEILIRQNESIFSSSLSFKHKITLVSKIAFIAFENETFFYEKRELINIIINYLQAINYPVENLLLNAENTLQSLIRENGLLIETAKGIYTFSHLSFQEFFIARKIVYNLDHSQQQDQLKQLARKIHNPQWRSTIFLTLEMLSEPNFLISELKQQINRIIIQNNNINKFFDNLKTKQKQLKININPEAIVAFYLGLLEIKDLNLAITLDIKIASELPQELSLDLALIRVLTLAEKLSQSQKIEEILELGFALDLDRKFIINEQLQNQLIDLKNQLLTQAEDSEQFLKWWLINASNWINQFRNIIIEYRLIGQNWQFNTEELKALQDYYDNSLFLVNCLKNQ